MPHIVADIHVSLKSAFESELERIERNHSASVTSALAQALPRPIPKATP
ncbi:hypothetical protein [Acerihabitans sp.]